MKLIVGLGNPGKEFVKTRHNIGFMAIDFIAENKKLEFKEKFNGLYAEYKENGDTIYLLKPLSYMNLSGIVVAKYISYFKIDTEDVLIIYDDVAFDFGKYKIKKSGSSGGHNGIDSIISMLKTDKISRVKLGIGKNNVRLDKYVLSTFPKTELTIINDFLKKIANIVEMFIKYSIEETMSIYNKRTEDEE